jgi:hypothetical protein
MNLPSRYWASIPGPLWHGFMTSNNISAYPLRIAMMHTAFNSRSKSRQSESPDSKSESEAESISLPKF